MSRSKSSKLFAGCKLVQWHRVVRVTLEKIPIFDFLKFPLSNRKKNSRCRAILLSPLGRNVVSRAIKKSLGQSRPSCPREQNVVAWGVTSAGLFSAWHPTCVFLLWCASEAASCPRHQTLNEDINFGQHLTAPLKKHFVGHSGASTVTFLSTTCLKSSVTFC